LWQPQGHVHGAIHLDRFRQFSLGLLSLSGGGIEGAETQVAMRLERAHAQFLGQRQGSLVVGFGLQNLWRVAPCRNVAEEARGICLVATFLVCMGDRQRPLRQGARLIQVAG
jgi:hypothetical protein